MQNTQHMAEEVRYQYVLHAYQDLAEISSGQEERTLLVRRTADGRVAVKKILSAAQGEIYRKMQTVNHPNIVPIWEVASFGGFCIVIMEYLSGVTLRELLQSRTHLFPGEAAMITAQLLNGLEILHGMGIIHRDIHPGNILVSTDNVVKLLDFGIARNIKPNQNKDTTILGTVGFAAPEQFGFAQTDVRTDIYSVGVLMNVMLTGRFPSVTLVQDEKLGQIVRKCIEISPQARYGGIDELRRELPGSGEMYVLPEAGSVPPVARGSIPGFRTGKLWKKIIAVSGYLMMILFSATFIVDGGLKLGVQGVLMELAAMLFFVWLPFLIASNFGNWDRKLFPFNRMTKDAAIAFRIALPFVCVYFGSTLDSMTRG